MQTKTFILDAINRLTALLFTFSQYFRVPWTDEFFDYLKESHIKEHWFMDFAALQHFFYFFAYSRIYWENLL